jgi:hypothetical protein
MTQMDADEMRVGSRNTRPGGATKRGFNTKARRHEGNAEELTTEGTEGTEGTEEIINRR